MTAVVYDTFKDTEEGRAELKRVQLLCDSDGDVTNQRVVTRPNGDLELRVLVSMPE